jgi:hypothetical protein
MPDPVQAVSVQPNYRRGPSVFQQVLWHASKGSDISTVYNGMCPCRMRVGVVGTLVVNYIDGGTCTLSALHMGVAAPMIECGTIVSLTATGSTAYDILLEY